MINDWWHDRLLAAGFSYLDLYANDKMSLETLAKLPTARQTIIMIYNCRVGRKKIEPIESLPDETKKALWAECKPYATGLNREEAIELSKCVWLLAQLAEMKETTTT